MSDAPDYRPRIAERHLSAASAVQPVVVVMGARQTGKSTLVRHHPAFRDYPYLSLDTADIRDQARADPAGLLARGPRLVLDEVQRVSDLMLAVKEAVDRQPRRTPGQFVLTGSANLLHMRRAADTLAGRASYTTLWPLTRRERLGLGQAGIWSELAAAPVSDWRALVEAQEVPAEDWRGAVRRSAYPTPALELATPDAQGLWMDGYVDTYLERDVRDVSEVARPLDLRRLMRQVCVHVGQVEDQTRWGTDAGVKRSTTSRYLDLLETSYQLIRLPAYAVNRTKRLTKSPKVYWSAPALAMHLAGVQEPTGFHLENAVVSDLVAWSSAQARRPAIMHWRTADRVEVDVVVEFPDGALLAVEIKGGPRPGFGDAAGVRLFLDEYPDALGALVLHGGDETYQLGERVLAAPWWRVM